MSQIEYSVHIRKLDRLSRLYQENLIQDDVLIKHQDKIVDDLMREIEQEEKVRKENGMTDSGTMASDKLYQYDAFLSYRRQEPDKAWARKLFYDLEAAGYKVAIDERDFRPQEPFLLEMERCVKESRFTLAVVSPRYLESGNTEQEGILVTVRDMRERQRRLIPLHYEETQMPDWIYILGGVHFHDPDPLVPPFKRLTDALGHP